MCPTISPSILLLFPLQFMDVSLRSLYGLKSLRGIYRYMLQSATKIVVGEYKLSLTYLVLRFRCSGRCASPRWWQPFLNPALAASAWSCWPSRCGVGRARGGKERWETPGRKSGSGRCWFVGLRHL